DGVPTRLSDLTRMQHGGAITPVHTIGLGRDVDTEALQTLATATGARFLPVETEEDLPGVFGVLQSYFEASHAVCVELPELECGELLVRVSWTWTPDDGPVAQGSTLQPVDYACPGEDETPEGRIVTLLLTLGDPGIPSDLSAQLALQAVEWASPRLRPHVLIVLDDGHNGEDVTDAELIQWLLADVDTLEVAYLDEPEGGLRPEDVEGYDVVWYANPGYPMDDLTALETLDAFAAAGGGVVLQGDDMTWSSGHAFETTPLTGLEHGDNGTNACGQRIDNGRDGTYTVTVGQAEHAVVRGLGGQTFRYGNDIDRSTVVSETAEVLAWAQPTGDPSCPPRP
ncbi:MAG: hypothetical protein KC656_35720, partial [Myxococcales bacterium]|nr:hypothetical protein [Myxococcales bacterium]